MLEKQAPLLSADPKREVVPFDFALNVVVFVRLFDVVVVLRCNDCGRGSFVALTPDPLYLGLVNPGVVLGLAGVIHAFDPFTLPLLILFLVLGKMDRLYF